MGLIPPPPEVHVDQLVKSFGDVATAGVEAVKAVIEHPENLTDGVRAGLHAVRTEISALLGDAGEQTRHVLDKVIELAKAVPEPKPAVPVDIRLLMVEVAAAISEAESILNNGFLVGHGTRAGGGLVIASGSIEIDAQVQIPGGGPGASAKLRFEITPKPYS